MTKVIEKGSKEALLKFAGALKDMNIDWEEKERRMKAFREEFNKHIECSVRYMREKRLETSQ